jgi:hypothetical protein
MVVLEARYAGTHSGLEEGANQLNGACIDCLREGKGGRRREWEREGEGEGGEGGTSRPALALRGHEPTQRSPPRLHEGG